MDSPIRAAFSVPLHAPNGKCLGSLACHYAETHVATNDEIARSETWGTLMTHLIAPVSSIHSRREHASAGVGIRRANKNEPSTVTIGPETKSPLPPSNYQ